jgi:excisionase family DNA binding protein
MRPRTRPGTRFSKVLDVHLTAQCLTVSADTVYDLFQHDALPGWKVGRTGLITTAAVLWWLEASTTQRTTAAQDAALARAPAGDARGGLGKRPWVFPPHDVSCGVVC